MVPLRNAHLSGDWRWSAQRKEPYANHLADPQHLIAVTASANRSKGARGPEEWKPEDRSYWCQYAIDWTTIKETWDLSVTQREHEALVQMLNTCANPPNLRVEQGTSQPTTARRARLRSATPRRSRGHTVPATPHKPPEKPACRPERVHRTPSLKIATTTTISALAHRCSPPKPPLKWRTPSWLHRTKSWTLASASPAFAVAILQPQAWQPTTPAGRIGFGHCVRRAAIAQHLRR